MNTTQTLRSRFRPYRLPILVVLICGLLAVFATADPGDLLHTFRSPAPNIFDHFGYSLTEVSGDLLVGSPFDDTLGVDTGAAYLFDVQTGALLRTFENPTPERGDYYGKSVAAHHGNALIGSPGEGTGRAYLRDAVTKEVMTVYDGVALGDYFGQAVGSSGDNVVVGALKEDTGGNTVGAVFVHDGTSGENIDSLFNPTPETEDYFGSVLAANNQFIAVGAKGDNTLGQNAGAVYVYSAVTRQLQHTLFAPEAAAEDLFGTSVGLWGSHLVVGAPYTDTDVLNDGVAYLFDAISGELRHTYRNPDPNEEAAFGAAVAVANNQVLIGAPRGDEQRFRGEAYLFDLSTGETLLAIPSPSELPIDEFGGTIAFVGHHLAVGAPYERLLGSRTGAVYVFEGVPEPTGFTIAALAWLFVVSIFRRDSRSTQSV